LLGKDGISMDRKVVFSKYEKLEQEEECKQARESGLQTEAQSSVSRRVVAQLEVSSVPPSSRHPSRHLDLKRVTRLDISCALTLPQDAVVRPVGKMRKITEEIVPERIAWATHVKGGRNAKISSGDVLWNGQERQNERLFDVVRWWLLYPGRLEFLCWVVGAIMLICMTSLFVLFLAVHLELLSLENVHR
jgi:hypothetical protein